MNRAILLLASALIGTSACHSNRCAQTSMTVYWSFQDAAGAPHTCADAGVDTVRVFIDGVAQQGDSSGGFTCTSFPNGVVFDDFDFATYDLRLEAYDTAGQILFASDQPVTINHCGDTQVTATLAAQQGSIVLQYAISNAGNQCPANSYIWFSLSDATANRVIDAVDGTHSPTSVPCGTEIAWDKMPFGEYRLDFIQVVQPTSDPSAPYVALYQACSPVAIHHVADEAVPVTLTAATTFCQ